MVLSVMAFGKLEKYGFMLKDITFLGFTIGIEEIKDDPSKIELKMCSAPILKLFDYSIPFEVECDASGKGIRAILIQKGKPVAYFSLSLNESRLNDSTIDSEIYAMVRAL